MSTLHFRALRSGIIGAIVLAVLVFLPAGTLDYWRGWAFLAVFAASTIVITVYLARNDPKLLERRMSAGPQAEAETAQKIIMTLTMLGFAALPVVSAPLRGRSSPSVRQRSNPHFLPYLMGSVEVLIGSGIGVRQWSCTERPGLWLDWPWRVVKARQYVGGREFGSAQT